MVIVAYTFNSYSEGAVLKKTSVPPMPTIPLISIFQGLYLWLQPLFPSKFVTPNTETPYTRSD